MSVNTFTMHIMTQNLLKCGRTSKINANDCNKSNPHALRNYEHFHFRGKLANIRSIIYCIPT